MLLVKKYNRIELQKQQDNKINSINNIKYSENNYPNIQINSVKINDKDYNLPKLRGIYLVL